MFSCVLQGLSNCSASDRFNLLGGPLETPWAYDRLFKKDITKHLQKLHIEPREVFDSDVYLLVEVNDVEGHALSPKNVLPKATIIFEPKHVHSECIFIVLYVVVFIRRRHSV